MEQPAGLMQHAHRTLSKSGPNHVLDLTDRGELGALTGLSKLDLTSKQAPENLRDELIVRVCVSAHDLFKDEKVVVGV